MRLYHGLFAVLAAATAAVAGGTHLEFRPCRDDVMPSQPNNDIFTPDSLKASLETVNGINGTHERLVFYITSWLAEANCKHWQSELVGGTVALDLFARPSTIQIAETNGSCMPIPRNAALLELKIVVTDDYEPEFYPLATLAVAIRMQDRKGVERSCVRSHFTPALGKTAAILLRSLPFVFFVFVLIVAVIRSVYDKPSGEDSVTPRSILPYVGDCLQYLQLVFLTGSLTLFYPGFFQPVISHVSWFSLFSAGIVSRVSHSYPGVSEGLYDVNGTYGGTYGLEIMTQVVGAPMTMDTWVNMVILFAIVLLGSAVVIRAFIFFRGSDLPGAVPLKDDKSVTSQIRQTGGQVLSVVLSYFMLPIVALTLYQLTYATILPLYHTSLAVLVVVIILLALVWLFRYLPARNLSIALFNWERRYQRLDTDVAPDRDDTSFITILFILHLIRGIAIGGLQISGPAQLAVLGTCELVLLVCIAAFQAYPLLSIGTVTAMSRLVVTMLMVAFIHGLASDATRSAIGYVILLLHVTIFLACFVFVPARDLLKLLAERSQAPEADVYGIRQLRRRQISRQHLPDRADSPQETGVGDIELGVRPVPFSRPSASERRSGSHDFGSSIKSNRYYRPPRSVSHANSFYSSEGRVASPLADPYSAVSVDGISPQPMQGEWGNSTTALAAAPRISFATTSDESSGSSQKHNSLSSSEAGETEALGPRWKDYSFRESDLYYRPGSAQSNTESIDAQLESEPSSTRSRHLKAVRKMFKGAPPTSEPTKGFEVIRRPPPQFREQPGKEEHE